MDKSGQRYRSRNGFYGDYGLNGARFPVECESPALVIIKLPDSRVLRIMSRLVFLAMFLLALPSLCLLMNASPGDDLPKLDTELHRVLPVLLRDLLDDGLIKEGENGLVFGDGFEGVGDDLSFLRDAGIDLFTGADLQTEKVVLHQAFDFIVTTSFHMIQQIDNVIKDNSLVVLPLGNDLSDDRRLLNNYKIVYLRRFDNTVVAMRKMRASDTAKGAFHGVTREGKKSALKGLEDAYLEPPTRAALGQRMTFTSRKIKFLPDLLPDSLDEHLQRVFISDDSSSLDWFHKNYPTRDQEFEVCITDQMGISTWLENNVRHKDCRDEGKGSSGGGDAQRRDITSGGSTIPGMKQPIAGRWHNCRQEEAC